MGLGGVGVSTVAILGGAVIGSHAVVLRLYAICF